MMKIETLDISKGGRKRRMRVTSGEIHLSACTASRPGQARRSFGSDATARCSL